MVERPDRALLRLHGLQGRRARQPEEGLEEDRHCQHHLPDLPRRRLLRRVLRVQEQSAGQLVPGLEMRCAWQCIGCLGYDAMCLCFGELGSLLCLASYHMY